MKHVVMCLFDRAAGFYGSPFASVSRAQAVRSFGDAVNGSQDAAVSNHPEDFELWELAVFDDAEGTFVNNPERVCLGSDLKRV